jgi:hypothetical protein
VLTQLLECFISQHVRQTLKEMTLLTAPMGFEQHAQSVKALLKDYCIDPVLIECRNVGSKRAMPALMSIMSALTSLSLPPKLPERTSLLRAAYAATLLPSAPDAHALASRLLWMERHDSAPHCGE